MNAQLKALMEERDHLHTLSFKARDIELPFTVTIDNQALPGSVTNKARWGITNYITMRLREIDAAIAEIKKEHNA